MGHLIDPDDCVLAVIDVQPGFLARVDDGDDIVQRIAFLALGAQFCAIPVIATVESPETWGPLDPRLAGYTAVRKEVFGLADDPLAGAAVRDTGRGTVVLTGLETDVCVAHSALGLLDSGHRVVVVEDAVGSPAAPRMAPASSGCGARESCPWSPSSCTTSGCAPSPDRAHSPTRIPGWPSRRACSCSSGLRADGTIA